MTSPEISPLDSNREIVFDAPQEPALEKRPFVRSTLHWWGPQCFTVRTHSGDSWPGGMWRCTTYGSDDSKLDTTVTLIDREGEAEVALRLRFATTEEHSHWADRFGAVEGGHETLLRLAEHSASLSTRHKFRFAVKRNIQL